MELQLFLERVCRHPTLQRAKIVQQFLESSEWHIDMHSYSGQAMGVSAGPHEQALPPPAHHGSGVGWERHVRIGDLCLPVGLAWGLCTTTATGRSAT